MIANFCCGNFLATVSIASAIRKPTAMIEVVLLLGQRRQVRDVVGVRLRDQHAALDAELLFGVLQALVGQRVERAVVEAADVGDEADLDLLAAARRSTSSCCWRRCCSSLLSSAAARGHAEAADGQDEGDQDRPDMYCGALLLLWNSSREPVPPGPANGGNLRRRAVAVANLVRRRSRSAGSAKLASIAVRVRPTSSVVAQTEVLARDRVLAADARAEVRRVVGAERDADARPRAGREGVLLEAVEDPEDDVARRAAPRGRSPARRSPRRARGPRSRARRGRSGSRAARAPPRTLSAPAHSPAWTRAAQAGGGRDPRRPRRRARAGSRPRRPPAGSRRRTGAAARRRSSAIRSACSTPKLRTHAAGSAPRCRGRGGRRRSRRRCPPSAPRRRGRRAARGRATRSARRRSRPSAAHDGEVLVGDVAVVLGRADDARRHVVGVQEVQEVAPREAVGRRRRRPRGRSSPLRSAIRRTRSGGAVPSRWTWSSALGTIAAAHETTSSTAGVLVQRAVADA